MGPPTKGDAGPLLVLACSRLPDPSLSVSHAKLLDRLVGRLESFASTGPYSVVRPSCPARDQRTPEVSDILLSPGAPRKPDSVSPVNLSARHFVPLVLSRDPQELDEAVGRRRKLVDSGTLQSF